MIAQHFGNENYVFMDDNAPVHRARIVKDFKETNNIFCTDWPAQSPDLNIIENIWFRLTREIQPHAIRINTRDQLIAAIRHAWENIPIEYVKELFGTISSRLREVIRMKGHLTKY